MSVVFFLIAEQCSFVVVCHGVVLRFCWLWSRCVLSLSHITVLVSLFSLWFSHSPPTPSLSLFSCCCFVCLLFCFFWGGRGRLFVWLFVFCFCALSLCLFGSLAPSPLSPLLFRVVALFVLGGEVVCLTFCLPICLFLH